MMFYILICWQKLNFTRTPEIIGNMFYLVSCIALITNKEATDALSYFYRWLGYWPEHIFD